MKRIVIVVIIVLTSFGFAFSQSGNEAKESSFGKNNVSIFLSDIVMKRISFEYEHVMGDKGNMSIFIPASAAVGDMEDIYGDVMNWWVGLGMKLYPTGQGVIRYFVGPEVRVISTKDTHETYYEGYNQVSDDNYIHTAFLLNNGMIYEPTKQFIFTVNMGVGIIARDSKDGGVYPMITPSVRMGIRF